MTMVSFIATGGKPDILLRCSTVGQRGVSPLPLPGCERARTYMVGSNFACATSFDVSSLGVKAEIAVAGVEF
jgi:hypothetical protein